MPVDGSFLTYVSDTVTIMRPMRSVFTRGVASSEKQAPTFSIRLSEAVERDIVGAAQALEMDKTAFIRWCAAAVATDILKQKAEYDKRMGNKPDQ